MLALGVHSLSARTLRVQKTSNSWNVEPYDFHAGCLLSQDLGLGRMSVFQLPAMFSLPSQCLRWLPREYLLACSVPNLDPKGPGNFPRR